MGKAVRWFKGLFGIKKEKENVETDSNCSSDIKKEKKRWSFAKSGKEIEGQVGGNDSAWLRSYISQTEKDQNKHAIAVAAATAAAADAAVAAAQAAVAVVRLTSHGRGTMFNGGREKWAAIKIQNVFRGYLARKALRALKGLVKLQALVRGYLVRKRAAATYHSMQALIRAQVAVRSQRARRSINHDSRFPREMRRRSIERFDECRSEYHSRRHSASYDASLSGFDESPKIVEIDTINKHRSRSRRINVNNTCMSDSGDDHHLHHHHHHQQHSHYHHPCPVPTSARLSIPDCHHFQEFDWNYVVGDDYKFATAQSTPRFANPHPPVTPSKSVCGESFFRAYSNYPSYMANTLSSRAKLRSQSAPKQRPEPGPKKRLSLNEIMASRTSFSGVRMQKPCTPVQEDYSAF